MAYFLPLSMIYCAYQKALSAFVHFSTYIRVAYFLFLKRVIHQVVLVLPLPPSFYLINLLFLNRLLDKVLQPDQLVFLQAGFLTYCLTSSNRALKPINCLVNKLYTFSYLSILGLYHM